MFQPGETVAITGRRGTFRVVRQEGDILHVYGGDPDPRGRRMHRAVSVSQVRQPRERGVACRRGCGRSTWNVTAVCEPCGDMEEAGLRRAEDLAERGVA